MYNFVFNIINSLQRIVHLTCFKMPKKFRLLMFRNIVKGIHLRNSNLQKSLLLMLSILNY